MSAPGFTEKKRSLLQNPFLLIVLFLVVTMAVALCIPPKLLNAADGVESKYRVLVSKLSSFLKSSENPDVVIMGSSLVLMPAVRCDERAQGKNPCYDPWYYARFVPEYTKSDYFQNILKEKLGLTLNVKNLGVASSLMSDQQGIFEAMIKSGKKPRLLVLGLAPRDFLDNTQPEYLKTPTRQFLEEYNETSLLPTELSVKGLQESAERFEHRFKMIFAFVKEKATALACKTSGNPASVEYSVPNPSSAERVNKLADLNDYKRLYNPPNMEMLNAQTGYLRDLLVSAKQNGVHVIVVNMPLTHENLRALDRTAFREYVRSVSRLSLNYNASYVDIGSYSGYQLSDFEDCCHLNAKGGKKFYNALVSNMGENDLLTGYLAEVSKVNEEKLVAAKAQTQM